MPLTFSFGGAGHHFPFMLGVAYGLKTHFSLPWEEVHAHCISSGCAGALALLLCSPAEIEHLATKAITLAHHPLQLAHHDYYLQLIKNLIPYGAYQRTGARLVVGTTELPLLRPVLYGEGYASQQRFLDILYASCRIPMITGNWSRELDGGFSHQYAISDENTIVVTLKRRARSDLAARESSYFVEMLLPSAERMWDLYEQGKRVVADNYEHLEEKITAGLADKNGEVRFSPLYR
jgi:hypothetical protein